MTVKSFFQLLITLILVFMLAIMSFFVAYITTSGGSFLGYEFSSVEVGNCVTAALIGLDKDGTRSDVLIIAQLDVNAGTINMLQVPRDTYMPDNGRKDHKINSSYGWNKEKGVFKEVGDLLGLHVDKYVTIDTSGFRDLIDTIGGVDFYVPQDMDYDDPVQDLHIHLTEGQQHLDGDKAEQLVRFRGYPNGDLDRMKVQSDFIQATIDKIFTVGNIVKINELVKDVSKIVKTNFTLNEMLTYAGYAYATDRDKILTYQLEGEGKYIGDVSYFVPDDDANEELVREYFTPSSVKKVSVLDIDSRIIGNGAVFNVGDVKIKKSTFNKFTSIDILDASGGEADLAFVKSELKKYGYNIMSVTNAKDTIAERTVVVATSEGNAVKRIASIMGLSEYICNPNKHGGSDITIVLGTDYKGE